MYISNKIKLAQKSWCKIILIAQSKAKLKKHELHNLNTQKNPSILIQQHEPVS